MSTPSEQSQSRVIGPFIGALSECAVRVCIGLPDGAIERLSCTLSGDTTPARTVESSASHGAFGVFTFDFGDLDRDQVYRYSFSAAGAPVDLQGLEPDDLRFRPIGGASGLDSLVLVSCHNPFKAKHGEDGWVMWKRLNALLEADPTIRLLILGGDQVYHDDVEKAFISRVVAQPDDDALADTLRQAFITNYHNYWGHLAYRKVLARIPSVAMWDDHDITDGWGGRHESFDKNDEIKPGWMRYFEIAREAFSAYQAVRNPDPLEGVPDGSFTTCLDWGPNRIYLCDFRSQKNSHKERFWAGDQEAAFFSSIESCSAQRVFVVSPVVPFRFEPGLEGALTALSKLAWWAFQESKKGKDATGWKKGLLSLLQHLGVVASFTDDLEDALMADCNRASFLRLLRKLFEARKQGRDVVILSGDIHTAGLSELSLQEQGSLWTIPQVVSSPIAYEPMQPKAEGLTTAVKQVVLEETDSTRIAARNGPYIPDRNFVKITPEALRHYDAQLPLEFHFENHAHPFAIPATLTPMRLLR